MIRKSKSLMQSEIFIIIMIILVLLYIITTMYASQLERKNHSLTKEINSTFEIININKELEKKDKKIKEQNSTIQKLKDENNKSKEILDDLNITYQAILKKYRDLNKTYRTEKKEQNSTIQKLKDENNKSKEILDDLNITYQAILKKYRDLNKTYRTEKQAWKKHKKPPLITLSEDKKDFRFGIGKAHLTKEYRTALLRDKFPELLDSIANYDCDVIEIYGYTDTQPFSKTNNIDDKLHQCINSDCSIDKITTHSNLELGMKRAISIVNFLKQQQKQGFIRKDIIIKPYSAGQFIDENGKVATRKSQDNMKRRRIEIRLSRSKEEDNSDILKE